MGASPSSPSSSQGEGSSTALATASNEGVVKRLKALIDQWREIEICLQCSAKNLTHVAEVFAQAQKVVIHPSGLIVTNYHVVEGAQNIRVSFEGEPESYVAELMSFVREEDLALLKIRPDEGRAATDPVERKAGGLRTAGAPREFPTVRLGTSADLMPGERVVAIGSPHGQAYTVSTGIISGLHREIPGSAAASLKERRMRGGAQARAPARGSRA